MTGRRRRGRACGRGCDRGAAPASERGLCNYAGSGALIYPQGEGRPLNLRDTIAEYPNFPKRGVLFRDFGPLLADPQAVSLALDEFERHFHHRSFDAVVGIESRGFAVGMAAAVRYGKGMIMIRKAGKLPGKTLKASYEIEYGRDTMELQKGAVSPGQRILICDDLLATGGTAAAAAGLVKKAGGRVAGIACIVELTDLGGAAKLAGYTVRSLVRC